MRMNVVVASVHGRVQSGPYASDGAVRWPPPTALAPLVHIPPH